MKKAKGVRRRRQRDTAHSSLDALRSELAHVRARFGLDPALPDHLLGVAWISPSGTMEDDEAEFVDAVADCVSVGLSLDAALASWISGDLARGEEAEEQADVTPSAASRLQADVTPSAARRLQAKHRIVVR